MLIDLDSRDRNEVLYQYKNSSTNNFAVKQDAVSLTIIVEILYQLLSSLVITCIQSRTENVAG
jgi:hypothetical protein